VADYHTYFVGSQAWQFSVWAHNADYEVFRLGDKFLLKDKKTGQFVKTPLGDVLEFKTPKEAQKWIERNAPPKKLAPDEIAKRMGTTAESRGWREALARGEQGIAGPKRKNVNMPGFDYATLDPKTGRIKIYDAKYRKNRQYPKSVSEDKRKRWKEELREFLETEYNGADKQALLEKLKEGKVDFEVYGWPS